MEYRLAKGVEAKYGEMLALMECGNCVTPWRGACDPNHPGVPELPIEEATKALYRHVGDERLCNACEDIALRRGVLDVMWGACEVCNPLRQKMMHRLTSEKLVRANRDQPTGDMTFQLTCTMRKRWVPHFLGMLKRMEYLGNIGSSRDVSFRSDGDGDFRPKFVVEHPEDLPEPAPPETENTETGDMHWDAG